MTFQLPKTNAERDQEGKHLCLWFVALVVIGFVLTLVATDCRRKEEARRDAVCDVSVRACWEYSRER